MLDALTRVRGAVSTKDLVPVLTHLVFDQGKVAGYDGRVYIQAPLPRRYRDLRCTVKADRFLAAIDACQGGDPDLQQTDGKLRVAYGDFAADLSTGDVNLAVPPQPDPPGRVKVPADFLGRLATIRPFVGEDASRQWACGLLLDGGQAYATNNVCLASCRLSDLGQDPVSIPAWSVDELLRIGDQPTGIGRSHTSITFHYADKSWLRTTVFDTAWPKPPQSLLDDTRVVTAMGAVTPDLKDAVQKVLPFCPDPKNPIVQLGPRQVSTLAGDFSARVDGVGSMDMQGTYRADALLLVLAVADCVDWSQFPRTWWQGAGMRGLLVGVHA